MGADYIVVIVAVLAQGFALRAGIFILPDPGATVAAQDGLPFQTLRADQAAIKVLQL